MMVFYHHFILNMQYLFFSQFRFWCILLAWLVFFSSSADEPDTSSPTRYHHSVWVGEHRFNTELANTLAKMQKGLMFRSNLLVDQAMLFIYPKPRQMHFWMKNTLITLDMLFFNRQGILQEIISSVPPCDSDPCPVYTSADKDNVFVLEINGGLAKKLNIQQGDKLYGCGI